MPRDSGLCLSNRSYISQASGAADMLIKFQSDKNIITSNIMASRLTEFGGKMSYVIKQATYYLS